MGSPVALALLLDATLAVPALDKLHVIHIPGKGRGVVAGRALCAGELIEVAPVIVVSAADKAILSPTILESYGYDWFADGSGLAVALGCGSLYNHSFEPNARYRKNFENSTIEYISLIDMPAGTEILINYNGDPADRTPLWFDVVS
ncbi:MAG: SET domain-containing protein [Deltaproteobacteria bacterium]|nr:SET domain-containing protein [Deltaproteobacteria bacterium]